MHDATPSAGLRAILGFTICRALVPLWVGAGATFKLAYATPANLPSSLFDIGTRLDKLGVSLYAYLGLFIAVEYAAVGIMLFVPRLARATAIAVLGLFLLVLGAEMARGNFTDCGCFGDVPVKPWMTATVDGLLLLGAITIGRGSLRGRREQPAWAVPAACTWSVAGAVATVVLMLRASAPPPAPIEPGPLDGSAVNAGPSDAPPSGTGALPLPKDGYWYVDDLESWKGRSWREIDLVRYMPAASLPAELLDEGTRFLIFYGRTCDHCETMFWEVFATDESIAEKVVAIEVPETKTVVTAENAWAMPETKCRLGQLPTGIDWIITTPLVLRLENGKIDCAHEGDHEPCM